MEPLTKGERVMERKREGLKRLRNIGKKNPGVAPCGNGGGRAFRVGLWRQKRKKEVIKTGGRMTI